MSLQLPSPLSGQEMGTASHSVLPDDIELFPVPDLSLATQAICKEDTPVNLNALKKARRDLQAIQSPMSSPTISAEIPVQTEPSSWWFEKIKEYLVPIALMGWELITQSGILSADIVKAIPIIGAFIGVFFKISIDPKT